MSAEQATWYPTPGFDGLTEAEEQEKSNRKGPSRIWLKPDTHRKVMFLTDRPDCFWEHCVGLGGKFAGNWYTCLGDAGPESCPLCMYGDRPYYVGMFSVVDLEPWTDKNGTERKNVKKILAAKKEQLKVFRSKLEARGSLAGCIYSFFRPSDRAANIGTDFEFLEKIGPEALLDYFKDEIARYAERKANFIEPFNIAELYKPKSAKELGRIAVRMQLSTNSSSSAGTSKSGDPVPF